jgi:enamine deaminase RidA (YjgF/YER057c/UK114 family)
VPIDADGNLVGAGDPAAQARRCLQNLLTLAACHEFSAGDIRENLSGTS